MKKNIGLAGYSKYGFNVTSGLLHAFELAMFEDILSVFNGLTLLLLAI